MLASVSVAFVFVLIAFVIIFAAHLIIRKMFKGTESKND